MGGFTIFTIQVIAKGKQYSLVTLLTVIFLAKLVGKDKPDEIADWAKNHARELAELWG